MNKDRGAQRRPGRRDEPRCAPILSEEMESSSPLWEVRWLTFSQGAGYDTLAQPGGWVLLLKRHAG